MRRLSRCHLLSWLRKRGMVSLCVILVMGQGGITYLPSAKRRLRPEIRSLPQPSTKLAMSSSLGTFLPPFPTTFKVLYHSISNKRYRNTFTLFTSPPCTIALSLRLTNRLRVCTSSPAATLSIHSFTATALNTCSPPTSCSTVYTSASDSAARLGFGRGLFSSMADCICSRVGMEAVEAAIEETTAEARGSRLCLVGSSVVWEVLEGEGAIALAV